MIEKMNDYLTWYKIMFGCLKVHGYRFESYFKDDLEEVQKFSLALSLNTNNTTDTESSKKSTYLKILKELYYSHYLGWFGNYCNREEYSAVLDKIYAKILNETSESGEEVDFKNKIR